jgi:hypothetical protein
MTATKQQEVPSFEPCQTIAVVSYNPRHTLLMPILVLFNVFRNPLL